VLWLNIYFTYIIVVAKYAYTDWMAAAGKMWCTELTAELFVARRAQH
jgi:hypothetical protein